MKVNIHQKRKHGNREVIEEETYNPEEIERAKIEADQIKLNEQNHQKLYIKLLSQEISWIFFPFSLS